MQSKVETTGVELPKAMLIYKSFCKTNNTLVGKKRFLPSECWPATTPEPILILYHATQTVIWDNNPKKTAAPLKK